MLKKEKKKKTNGFNGCPFSEDTIFFCVLFAEIIIKKRYNTLDTCSEKKKKKYTNKINRVS